MPCICVSMLWSCSIEHPPRQMLAQTVGYLLPIITTHHMQSATASGSCRYAASATWRGTRPRCRFALARRTETMTDKAIQLMEQDSEVAVQEN